MRAGDREVCGNGRGTRGGIPPCVSLGEVRLLTVESECEGGLRIPGQRPGIAVIEFVPRVENNPIPGIFSAVKVLPRTQRTLVRSQVTWIYRTRVPNSLTKVNNPACGPTPCPAQPRAREVGGKQCVCAPKIRVLVFQLPKSGQISVRFASKN